jgi:threonyl-tRNA synthetase
MRLSTHDAGKLGQKFVNEPKTILNELRANQVCAELDESSDKINGKIQRAEQTKVHTMLLIGKRDIEADTVTVRGRVTTSLILLYTSLPK